MTAGVGPLDVLARIRTGSRPRPPGERCEMCGAPIADEHGHVVDTKARHLMCTCRPCYLLFPAENAQLAYRAVPERRLSLPGFAMTRLQWDDLQIPVGLAFFFVHSALGRTVAFYPSPAGATESELPLGAWDRVVADNPVLGDLLPDVEAVLVRADDAGGFECFLVPIDACYELVGQLRAQWRGFDGGTETRRRLEQFFARLRERSRPAPSPAGAP
jgi:hypothetical protein